MVEVTHGYGIVTRYGHLSKSYVKVGQRVKRGERIAAIGNSGRATGPHLHYEVRLNDVPLNPQNYILN
jgi:murein DD-endopeptidase MepM/ murein hydrolase activator NlpD